jgi:hypothetical protein
VNPRGASGDEAKEGNDERGAWGER